MYWLRFAGTAGPASRLSTRLPAVASCRARSAPLMPAPTITTSTCGWLGAWLAIVASSSTSVRVHTELRQARRHLRPVAEGEGAVAHGVRLRRPPGEAADVGVGRDLRAVGGRPRGRG